MGYYREIDMMTWCKQCEMMLASGMDLSKVLFLTSRQTSNKRFSALLGRVHQSVLSGNYLHEALLVEAKFPTYYAHLIETGEYTGQLTYVLKQLGDYIEQRCAQKRQMKKAFAYPILLVIGILGVLLLFRTVVLPVFISLFEAQSLGIPLGITYYIDASNWLFGKGGFMGLVGVLVLVVSWHNMSVVYRRSITGMMLLVPGIGRLRRLSAMVTFCELLAMLLGAGVPLLSACERVKEVFYHDVMYKELVQLIEAIRKGESFGSSMASSKVMTNFVKEMVAIGEQSGDLEGTLVQAARFTKQELEAGVATMIGWIEPTLTIGMAAIVGGMIYMIFVPTMSFAMQLL